MLLMVALVLPVGYRCAEPECERNDRFAEMCNSDIHYYISKMIA